MPVCPKCGKCFSTEQALRYHLNKKYKCGTWRCEKCKCVFETQFALKIHNISCESERPQGLPSFDILCSIYNNKHMIFLEKDDQNIIHNVSPGVTTLLGKGREEYIGKKDDSEILEDCIYRPDANGNMIKFIRKPIHENLYVEMESSN